MNFLVDEFIEGARFELYAPDFKTCKDKMVFGYEDFLRLGSFFKGMDEDFEVNTYNSGYNVTATFGELGTWIQSCYHTEYDVRVEFL